MSDAQQLIAEVAAKHALYYDEYADQWGSAFQCKCGWQPDPETVPDNDQEAIDTAHGQHLAAEIDTALGGLTRQTLLLNQYAAANGTPEQRQYRWASDWADS